MYRVVLIDDEKLIVEGLRKVVRWKDYDCEVVATAEDAVRGAEAIRVFRPHILFTDIRMPGQDGLAMLAGLRSESPRMQVVVLTGEALTAATEQLKQEAPEEDAESQNAGSFLVNRAMAYMKQHCAEKLTLQDVADACYVSQWHLSKLLNRSSGKSFYDILNALRVDAAKELLADPSLRIGDISEMVGYADSAHFARVFKKLTGLSANEYRNSL